MRSLFISLATRCGSAWSKAWKDEPNASARDAVHVLLAGEKVFPDDPVVTPDVSESESIETHRMLNLEALVRMKLTSFHVKDRMHLLDMIEVELIDESCIDRYPTALAARLKQLIDKPNA